MSQKWHALSGFVRVYRYGVAYAVRMRDVRVGDLVRTDSDEQGVQQLLRVTSWDDAS